jgi:hypothetical protein
MQAGDSIVAVANRDSSHWIAWQQGPPYATDDGCATDVSLLPSDGAGTWSGLDEVNIDGRKQVVGPGSVIFAADPEELTDRRHPR